MNLKKNTKEGINMIGDRARGVISACVEFERPTRMMISLKLDELVFGTTCQNNPDYILTNGQYYLFFATHTRTGDLNKKKFCITYDFGRGFSKFIDWEDFLKQSRQNPHVRFIRDFTNISKQHFNIAYQNEQMRFPVTFDLIKYDTAIREKFGYKKDEYAMIYNPFKEVYDRTYIKNENGEVETWIGHDHVDKQIVDPTNISADNITLHSEVKTRCD